MEIYHQKNAMNSMVFLSKPDLSQRKAQPHVILRSKAAGHPRSHILPGIITLPGEAENSWIVLN